MIVTCPSCSARYKINESKIAGRGAKITCPRCAHRFVVYRDGEDKAAAERPATRKVPDNIAQLDFGTLGITWRVRKGIGITYDFLDLSTLQGFLGEGQVDRWDAITFDNREWTPIESIPDLERYFFDVWQRAQRGEISIALAGEEDDARDEDDSDAPTAIVGRGSSLDSEIRQALTEPPAEADSSPAHASSEPPLAPRKPVLASASSGASGSEPAPLSVVDAKAPPPTPSPGPAAQPPAARPPESTSKMVVGGIVLLLIAAAVVAGLWFGGVVA